MQFGPKVMAWYIASRNRGNIDLETKSMWLNLGARASRVRCSSEVSGFSACQHINDAVALPGTSEKYMWEYMDSYQCAVL